MVFGVAMEGIEFRMIFGVFSVVVRGGLEDGLGRLVRVVFGRTKTRFVVGATLFRSVRAP